jgi:penicillin V acylase-like amidase (Ntn superfamily)
MTIKKALLVGALTALASRDASACTTFCLERNGSVVFGKNYDFGIGYRMLVVNKRGVSKTALVDPPNRSAK